VLLHRWSYGIDERDYRAGTIACYISSNGVTGEKEEGKMAKVILLLAGRDSVYDLIEIQINKEDGRCRRLLVGAVSVYK